VRIPTKKERGRQQPANPNTESNKAKKDTDPYVVYKIVYGPNKKVWKYGITKQKPWQTRTNAQKPACNAQMKVKDCDGVLIYQNVPGYLAARWKEYWLLKGYIDANNGYCPPGHKAQIYCK